MRDPGSVSYDAAVESAASRDTDPRPSPFAQRAYREAQRWRLDAAGRRVVLGDGAPWNGAPWIWNLAGEQFPGAMTRTPRRLADSAIPPRLRHNGARPPADEPAASRCRDDA